MQLSSFANIPSAVAHAKALRQNLKTTKDVAELTALEAELVVLGIGYVATAIAAVPEPVKPVAAKPAPVRAVKAPAAPTPVDLGFDAPAKD